MKVEKLKRVQSVRKWLEKAEKSFSSDKEISGDLNLIMAQAEMQRLRESDPALERKKNWGMRFAAVFAAAGLIAGASSVWDLVYGGGHADAAPPAAIVEVQKKEAAPENAVIARPEPSEKIAAVPAAATEETVQNVQTVQPAAAIEAPILSQQEIQSVVGEAGRALRGQS